MTGPVTTTAAQDERGMRILHAVLAAGIAIIIALFVFLVGQIGPSMPAGSARPLVAYAASGLGLAAILAVPVVLRPLARGRLRDAPTEHRWNNDTRGPAILVWIVAEWGALAGCIGFLLTASTFPAGVGALGLVTLLWSSPGRLSAA